MSHPDIFCPLPPPPLRLPRRVLAAGQKKFLSSGLEESLSPPFLSLPCGVSLSLCSLVCLRVGCLWKAACGACLYLCLFASWSSLSVEKKATSLLSSLQKERPFAFFCGARADMSSRVHLQRPRGESCRHAYTSRRLYTGLSLCLLLLSFSPSFSFFSRDDVSQDLFLDVRALCLQSGHSFLSFVSFCPPAVCLDVSLSPRALSVSIPCQVKDTP